RAVWDEVPLQGAFMLRHPCREGLEARHMGPATERNATHIALHLECDSVRNLRTFRDQFADKEHCASIQAVDKTRVSSAARFTKLGALTPCLCRRVRFREPATSSANWVHSLGKDGALLSRSVVAERAIERPCYSAVAMWRGRTGAEGAAAARSGFDP